MLKGRHTTSLADFESLRASLFIPNLYDYVQFGATGCGATALAMLIGKHPESFAKRNRNRRHYSDRFVVKVLRENGFTIVPITQKGITSSNYIGYPLHNLNVLLVSQRFAKKENSWVVIQGEICYHNFQLSRLERLDFVNHPILTCYCVWHPKYKI